MKFKVFLLTLLFIISSPALAVKPTYGNLTVSEVVSVYDGDTFKANICHIHPIIGEKISVRIAGIDTPEIRGKTEREKRLAIKARDFAEAKLRCAKQVSLRHIRRDKYFRLLADVYCDGQNLAQALIDAKLAVPYDGGKKRAW